MGRTKGAVHVVRVRTSHTDQQGRRRDYESAYLRRTFREGGRIRNQTVANLSSLPAELVEVIRRSLAGEAFVPAGEAATITRSIPHGHVAAVWAQAKALGLPGLLGPAGRRRDLAMALVIARVLAPGSKLAATSWRADTTLGADLDLSGASTDEVSAAMDWLLSRQDAIEATLAKRHLAPATNPSPMALFDLSSSWIKGRCCPLAARGQHRDGKKNRPQIESGLLTDPAGRPVAVRVFEGSTADPTGFTTAVAIVTKKVKLAQMVMVGDRGMITSARITALRDGDLDNQTNHGKDTGKRPGTGEPGNRDSGEAVGSDNNDSERRLDWLTALRAPAIKRLAADAGPRQTS